MQITNARREKYQFFEGNELPPAAFERLVSLGITTVDELRDHWQYGNRRQILDYLGDSLFNVVRPEDARMLATRSGPSTSSSIAGLMSSGRPRPLVKHARGVILSAKERGQRAAAPAQSARSALRATRGAQTVVSLIDRFPAVRNQKDRGTCVAFSTVAFLEFHLRGADPEEVARRSEQFVYWACKMDDGLPNVDGTFVSTARGVLKKKGACLHKTWKYNPKIVPGNESQGPPLITDAKLAKAESEALGSRWSLARVVAAKKPEKIREQLDLKKPVVLSVSTFASWDFGTTGETGDIPMPFPNESPDGGHAICVVGYETDASAPGGGRFIFRNSWGTTWAKPNGRFGAGYGTLPFDYIKQFGLEAYA